MALIAIALPDHIKLLLIVPAFVAVIIVATYSYCWRMLVTKDLTAAGWKRTGLFTALMISFAVFIGLDSLSESILYSLLIILVPVLLAGIPVGKRANSYIHDDRRDFREGKTVWEKIKIWVLY